MADKQTVNFGTLCKKTGTKEDGSEFEFYEIDLRQDIDIYHKGKKLNFSSYSPKGSDATLHNKRIAVTDSEFVLGRIREKNEELADKMQADFEKKGVVFSLSVNPRNLA